MPRNPTQADLLTANASCCPSPKSRVTAGSKPLIRVVQKCRTMFPGFDVFADIKFIMVGSINYLTKKYLSNTTATITAPIIPPSKAQFIGACGGDSTANALGDPATTV